MWTKNLLFYDEQDLIPRVIAATPVPGADAEMLEKLRGLSVTADDREALYEETEVVADGKPVKVDPKEDHLCLIKHVPDFKKPAGVSMDAVIENYGKRGEVWYSDPAGDRQATSAHYAELRRQEEEKKRIAALPTYCSNKEVFVFSDYYAPERYDHFLDAHNLGELYLYCNGTLVDQKTTLAIDVALCGLEGAAYVQEGGDCVLRGAIVLSTRPIHAWDDWRPMELEL